MTAIEKRLDAIIELLVLLVNQTESQTTHTESLCYRLMESNEGFQDYGKILEGVDTFIPFC